MKKNKAAVFFALLAAALYAINIPMSKLLIDGITPAMLAGLLYFGAGVGMALTIGLKKLCVPDYTDAWLDKKDARYTVAMVVLDIAAPILLMYGIANTSSANASLLNNFEIVATSIIALAVFGERISKWMWSAVGLVTLASIILGFEEESAFVFNKGSVLVLCACVCWGIENNCTKNLSHKSSEQIVMVKGIFSGIGSMAVALLTGEGFPGATALLLAMLLGFVSYGLSINFYIMAQKSLGAAKTSAFYAVAPFFGVGFSFLIVGERPLLQFYIALAIMAVATVMMIWDTLR